MFPIRTILHATDFSAQSQCAFQLACALARDYGALLVITHVKPLPAAVMGGEFGYVVPADPVEEERALREELSAVQPVDSGIRVEHRLVEGDPVSGIVTEAEACQSDLIVMGTHGRRGLGRLLLGSVAEGVLRRAPCPVLTVKSPMPAHADAKEEPVAAMTA
jgi:nucleotide-binding universal stress UspA family protein